MIDGPLIGIRMWLVNRSSDHPTSTPPGPIPGLKSSNALYVWQPGMNTARCNTYNPPVWFGRGWNRSSHKSDEPIPADGCVCGLHAFYSMDECMQFWQTSPMGKLYRAGFVGLVRGWGRSRLHVNGWRSLYAEPVALLRGVYESMNEHMMDEVASVYSIPILQTKVHPPDRFATLPDQVLEEFGTIVPKDERPRENPKIT